MNEAPALPLGGAGAVIVSLMLTFITFTTEYDPIEDRIRVIGSDAGGATATVWLNFRLLQFLLPPLFAWFEKVPPTLSGSAAQQEQQFRQSPAYAAVTPQAPVVAAPSGREWLAVSVDYTTGEGGLRLVLKDQSAFAQAAIVFDHLAFRQWLGIVYQLCAGAGWSLAIWPSWIKSPDSAAGDALPSVN